MVAHAVILAGGRSTRMGRDKAMMPLHGATMLEHVARTVHSVVPPLQLYVVGRPTPAGWPDSLRATFLPDREPHASADGAAHSGAPLVGLITALEALRAPVLLLPCDLPLLEAATIQELLRAHRDGAAHSVATIAVSDADGENRAEPTFAVYEPGILSELHKMLRENRRSLRPLIELPNVTSWRIPPERMGQLLNVNEPKSFAQVEEILQNRVG